MQALEKGAWYLQGESGKKITERWEGDGRFAYLTI